MFYCLFVGMHVFNNGCICVGIYVYGCLDGQMCSHMQEAHIFHLSNIFFVRSRHL